MKASTILLTITGLGLANSQAAPNESVGPNCADVNPQAAPTKPVGSQCADIAKAVHDMTSPWSDIQGQIWSAMPFNHEPGTPDFEAVQAASRVWNDMWKVHEILKKSVSALYIFVYSDTSNLHT